MSLLGFRFASSQVTLGKMGGVIVYREDCPGTLSIRARAKGLICLKGYTDGKTLTAPLAKHPLNNFSNTESRQARNQTGKR